MKSHISKIKIKKKRNTECWTSWKPSPLGKQNRQSKKDKGAHLIVYASSGLSKDCEIEFLADIQLGCSIKGDLRVEGSWEAHYHWFRKHLNVRSCNGQSLDSPEPVTCITSKIHRTPVSPQKNSFKVVGI